ncbi:MAG TPA: hypothetical protein VLA72_16650 [Anaerolineales bacterium]|nr:hypothetical protein [Anaerolineales bacterium]
MKLNVMFTIAAVYAFLIGIPALFVPTTMIAATGMLVAANGTADALSGVLMTARFLGVELIGLGLIAWLVRNAEASKARDGVTLGLTIYFALHALTSLYGQFTDTSTSLHWVMATVQGLIAIGFFMAGRASMSTSAS